MPGPKRQPERPRSRANRPNEGTRGGVVGRPKTDWSEVTHCTNGHEYSQENTYVVPNTGQKVCKRCRRDSQRKYQGKDPLDGPVGVWNRHKTHCPAGHEYTEENTYLQRGGTRRRCRRCRRDQWIRKTYGIEPADYDDFLFDQDGGCAICGWEPPEDEFLHVDHEHGTSRVRGLLCNNCNNGLGRFEDSAELLRKAANYVSR